MSQLALCAGLLIANKQALYHIDTRVLEYTGGKSPISSLNRAFKFHKRGYSIGPESLLSLLRDISDDLKDLDDMDALVQLRLESDYDRRG